MKSLSYSFLFTVFISSTTFLSSSFETGARDLTYKIGAGYRQLTTNAAVKNRNAGFGEVQLNAIEATYGIAPDISAGAHFGFLGNLDFVMVGPSLRYDFHRLFGRDPSIWDHLHLFAEVKFLAKFGKEYESGLTLHAPYFGFEILPFSSNNFAILTSAGVIFDWVEESRVGWTNSMFGDVGVKYYF